MEDNKRPSQDKKKVVFNFTYFFITIVIVYFIQGITAQKRAVHIPYNEFLILLEQDKIKELHITKEQISGTLSDNVSDNPVSSKHYNKSKYFKTNIVDHQLSEKLQQHKVKYTKVIENTFISDMISWIFPTLFFLGLWFFIIKKMGANSMGGGFMSVGKSKAKVYMEKDIGVSFSDVAGVDEAKSELIEVVDFLKNSEKYARLGGRMPKGVLLVGPPGTGKTLMAKAVAGEASVPFFSISGSEFVEMFVGVGAARVRDLFDQARKAAPCIIFIDELDALGKARNNSPMGGGHDEKEQTLNQLLTELDGFDSSQGVILLAATNRPDSLDPALLRSGRFDRQVLIDRPDKTGRLAILKVHTKKIQIQPNLDMQSIADLTTGFTGADLANLVNEAALVAIREAAKYVEINHFTMAIERIVAGLEKKTRVLSDFEREVVSYHEMGHALVANALNTTDVVHKVSIIPRGMGALGYTIQRPKEDRFILKKEELSHKITTLLGGRAAEKLVFNHLSTGASDDLVKATDIAKDMVLKYAMVNELGHVVFNESSMNFLGQKEAISSIHGEKTLKLIDESIKNILDQCFEHALNILTKNRDILNQSSTDLLSKETLTEADLEIYFSKLENSSL